MTPTPLVLALGLAALPGCAVAGIEAEVPEVCLDYPNLRIDTTTGAGATQRFAFDDLSAVHDLTRLDADLRFVRTALRATSGIESFAFVEAAHLVVSSGDPGSTLPPLTMYACDGNCAPEGDRLVVPPAARGNAIAYLASSSIVVDLELQGESPAPSWTMDIDVCLTARAGYTLGP